MKSSPTASQTARHDGRMRRGSPRRRQAGTTATDPVRDAIREVWKARIQLRGVNPFVVVARTRVQRIRPNWKRPIPVRFRINRLPAQPARVNLVPVGDGTFYLYLNELVRRATRTAVGDRVEISAEFDDDYRGGPAHPEPQQFAAGLRRDPAARRAWHELPPSGRKEILRYLSMLKSEGSRERNIERALRVLGGAKGRFLGKPWNDPPAPGDQRKRRGRRSTAKGVR